MEVRVLGSLEVLVDGTLRDPGSLRHREVLAVLALDVGRVVPAETIVDRVWGGAGASLTTLQAIVSRLRSRLGPDSVITQAPGYLLNIDAMDVDSVRFEAAVSAARAMSDAVSARASIVAALAMWRGRAYADIPFAAAEQEAERLADVRIAAEELLAELELQLGRHVELTQRLPPLLAEHPIRESLLGSMMLALYRSGRQVEALAHFDAARAQLRDELGIDPGPALQGLHGRILQQDPNLLAAVAPAAQPAPAATAADTGGRTRAGSTADAHARMVGRAEQLAVLHRVLERGGAREQAVAVVVGEAGIGKTTLLAESLVSATDRTVVWGRCADHDRAPALWPWEQALSDLVETIAPDRLIAALSGRAAAAKLILPGHDVADLKPADGPAAARDRLYEAVVALLDRVSADRPVVVVLEDLQWADRESIELAEHVAASLRSSAVTLMLSVRDPSGDSTSAGQDTMAAMLRIPGVEHLRLEGLTVDEVRTLVEDRIGATLDRSQATALRDRTEGNPFYLSELALLLTEARRETGRADVPVPSSVRAVIDRRLRNLAEVDQTLLRTAAVIGRTFDLAVLAEVAKSPRWEVMDALDRAIWAGLLAVGHEGTEQRFAHALVQEALAASLGPMQRASIHGRIAAVLEGRRGEDTIRTAALAHHYAAAGAAGDPERAVIWSLRTAELAEARVALHEAERNVRQALALIPLLDQQTADTFELDARVHLGSLLTLRLGYNAPEVAAERLRARELAETVGSASHFISALWGTWGNALVSGQFETALDVCRELESAAHRTGEPLLDLAFSAARGQTLWHLGRLATARADLERAIELSAQLEHRIPIDLFLQHPGLQAQGWLAIVLVMQGEVDRSDLLAADSVARAAALGHAFTSAYVDILEGLRAIWLWRYNAAVEHGQRGLGIAMDNGFDQLSVFSLIPLGWGTSEQDPAQGIVQLQSALDILHTLPAGHMFGHLTCGLIAEARIRAGLIDEADGSLRSALEESRRTGEQFHLPRLHLLVADIAEARGADPAPALAEAERVAHAQGAVLLRR